MERESARFSSFLDLARWLSALIVLICHVAHLVVAHAELVVDPPWWLGAFYVLRDCHDAAVIVFFVLSGYLVGGAVIAGLRAGSFDPWRYALNRASRLYPVLVVALALGAGCDLAGLAWFNSHGLYDDRLRIPDFDGAQVGARLGWDIALWNLLHCQTITAPALGSNLPLWSLAYEAWYYLLFPAALIAVWPGWPLVSRLVAGGLFIAGCCFVTQFLLMLGAVWVLGALAAAWRGRLALCPWLALALCLALVLAQASGAIERLAEVASLPGRMRLLAGPLAVGCGFTVLLLTMRAVNAERAAAPLRGGAFHERMAGFSYSLYLTHYPVAVLLLAILQSWWGVGLVMAPGWPALLVVLTVSALALAVGYAVSLISERHTPRIRAWLLRWCGQRRAAALH